MFSNILQQNSLNMSSLNPSTNNTQPPLPPPQAPAKPPPPPLSPQKTKIELNNNKVFQIIKQNRDYLIVFKYFSCSLKEYNYNNNHFEDKDDRNNKRFKRSDSGERSCQPSRSFYQQFENQDDRNRRKKALPPIKMNHLTSKPCLYLYIQIVFFF